MDAASGTFTAVDLRNALLRADPRLSRFKPLSRILVFDDFNSGAHGWTELCGNYNSFANLDSVEPHKSDFRPPQLSSCTFFDNGTHGAMSGTYALKLASRAVAGHTAVAIRRLTMAGRGLVQFETFFTYKAEAAIYDPRAPEPDQFWDGNNHRSEQQFGAFTIGTDICDSDGVRYHCIVRYQNTDLEGRRSRSWVYPRVPEPTTKQRLEGAPALPRTADFTAPSPDDWRSFGEQNMCFNEVPSKINWHYLRWLMDTDRRTNVELQVNDTTFDIRHLPVPVYGERYDALETLLNFYVSVRTHVNVRNFVFLDSALISVDWE